MKGVSSENIDKFLNRKLNSPLVGQERDSLYSRQGDSCPAVLTTDDKCILYVDPWCVFLRHGLKKMTQPRYLSKHADTQEAVSMFAVLSKGQV